VSGVFISYRGDDTDTAAVLIDQELAARFGNDRVFLDSRSILAGSDFAEELLRRLRACSVLLVVIGPRWLTLTDSAGRRRIDDPQDWIRREIAEALTHRLRVIPVLTGDATLPTEADLPADIAGLSRRQYVPLRRRYTPVDLAFLVERITEADPELATAVAVRRSSPGTVPRQLPAAVAHFAGRGGELATLSGLLRDRADTGGTVVVSAVSGTAGVGKTALAVYWGHQVAYRFPDGQLYVNLRGFDPSGQVMAPVEAVRRFLDALQVPPERIPVDLDAQAALYRSELAGKRMLVVLDNARDTAQVRQLLPGAPTCLVLVTSRNQLTGLVAADGAELLTLELLSVAEADELLSRRLGSDRIAAEPQAVQEIITQCARLPLALAIVAARAAAHPQFPLHTLAAELRDRGERLDSLTSDDPHGDVRAVFSWSYRILTPEAARLFRLLGLHPGPDLSAPAAASLAGSPPTQVRPLLTELTRANLLVEHTPGRYSFHDLLRVYAADLAQRIDTNQQRHTAIGRILDHYLRTAHIADRLLDPARDPITLTSPQPGVTPEHLAGYQHALDWFTAERPVLLAAVDQAAATGFDAHTWQLAWTLWVFFDRRGHWRDWAAAGRAGLAAAQRLADPAAQARTHFNVAHAYTKIGRLDDAHTELTHALDLATQVGDLAWQAHIQHMMAILWERRGNYPQALDHARQALRLHESAGHQGGQAEALNTVGWYHTLLGDHQQALTACQEAIALFQSLGDRDGQAATWDSLGYAQHHLGQHVSALTSYQQALILFRDLGDRHKEAITLTHLGDSYHTTGNRHAAHDAWQQALTILDDLHHPDADQLRTKLATLDTPFPDAADADVDHDDQEAGDT
jgi:tetratricopeptide (TPR) repeat protein